MHLYDYQERVIAEVEQHKNPLIVSPTGSGKTVMASAIIERNPNKFVLFFIAESWYFSHAIRLPSVGLMPASFLLASP